ncbi:hypothetical protein [Nostoc sp.]|uniref:hypothetical protein n=1 Tax=Nostoc sp. TaxID=1180 RepID=UPI003FA568B3
MNSHSPVLTQKSTAPNHHNPKTHVVVPVVTRVIVAIRRAAIPGIVVPRTTTQQPVLPTLLFRLTR